MHTHLVTGRTRKMRLEKIDELITSFHGSSFDRRVLDTPDGQPSITVFDVREWTRSLSFSGPKGHPLIGIIPDAHRMTPEAQAALLKTLEEPPGNVQIFIEVENGETLLPTIRSRGALIFLGTSVNAESEAYPESVESILEKAQEHGKTKIDAEEYLKRLMGSLHVSWMKNPHKTTAQKLKNCIIAFRMLSVNVSPQSVIEHALFS